MSLYTDTAYSKKNEHFIRLLFHSKSLLMTLQLTEHGCITESNMNQSVDTHPQSEGDVLTWEDFLHPVCPVLQQPDNNITCNQTTLYNCYMASIMCAWSCNNQTTIIAIRQHNYSSNLPAWYCNNHTTTLRATIHHYSTILYMISTATTGQQRYFSNVPDQNNNNRQQHYSQPYIITPLFYI